MSPDEVLRHLRRIRFSPRAGRPVSLAWIGRQAGYRSHHVLHTAIGRGSISLDMAKRLSPILARIQLGVVQVQQGDNSPTLGPLGGGTGRIPVGRALPRGSGRPPGGGGGRPARSRQE